MLSCFSLVQLFATQWTVACQAPLSTGFSRQEFSRRVAMPSSRVSSQARDQTHRFFTTSATWEAKKDCLGGGNMKEKCLVQFLRVVKRERICNRDQKWPTRSKAFTLFKVCQLLCVLDISEPPSPHPQIRAELHYRLPPSCEHLANWLPSTSGCHLPGGI